jgi:hypothetical protein
MLTEGANFGLIPENVRRADGVIGPPFLARWGGGQAQREWDGNDYRYSGMISSPNSWIVCITFS